MSPGDTWSVDDGFTLSGTTWWDDRLARMTVMAEDAGADFAATAGGGGASGRRLRRLRGPPRAPSSPSVPRPALRILLKRPIVFHVAGDDLPYWVVDARRRRVWRQATPPPTGPTSSRWPPAILADAIEKRILHFVQGGCGSGSASGPAG